MCRGRASPEFWGQIPGDPTETLGSLPKALDNLRPGNDGGGSDTLI